MKSCTRELMEGLDSTSDPCFKVKLSLLTEKAYQIFGQDNFENLSNILCSYIRGRADSLLFCDLGLH